MVFSLWLWPRLKSTATKNTPQMLAILKAMRVRQCDLGRIAQWSTSMDSCGATRFHHWESAHAVLPRWPPWSTISNETKEH
jgi:hypothetical protein